MAGVTIRVPGFTAVPVHASDGSVWDVGVQWLPRGPRLLARWRTKDVKVTPGDVLDAAFTPDAPGDGIVAGILLAIGTVILFVVLVLFVLPALLLVVDVLVLVVAALLAVLGRVLLGRPWRVVARCTSGPSAGEEQAREVHGVRAARRARDELRRSLAGGGPGVTVVPL